MSGEYEQFDLDRTFAFKIDLQGEDFTNSTNSTDQASTDADAESGNIKSTGTSSTDDNSADTADDFQFEGVQVDSDRAENAGEVEPLRVSFYSITPTGLLNIKFNKPFIEPPIRLGEGRFDEKRELE